MGCVSGGVRLGMTSCFGPTVMAWIPGCHTHTPRSVRGCRLRGVQGAGFGRGIVEPTSKVDTIRVLGEVGVPYPSRGRRSAAGCSARSSGTADPGFRTYAS